MVTILQETTKNPITLIGERAGICWGADITDSEKNYKRGLDCIKCNHGRTLEFVNVEMVLEGYSARVIREWYTHIGGSPTRLQESTRYIDFSKGFDYYTPDTLEKDKDYHECMEMISKCYNLLLAKGVSKEDAANILPLGMTTKIVDKRNLRSLSDMSNQRMCNRALGEYRKLFRDIITELEKVSDEWKEVVKLLFIPKCEKLKYCPERYSCGRFKNN